MTEDELINHYIELGRKDVSFADYKKRYEFLKRIEGNGLGVGGTWCGKTGKATNWTIIESLNNYFTQPREEPNL